MDGYLLQQLSFEIFGILLRFRRNNLPMALSSYAIEPSLGVASVVRYWSIIQVQKSEATSHMWKEHIRSCFQWEITSQHLSGTAPFTCTVTVIA